MQRSWYNSTWFLAEIAILSTLSLSAAPASAGDLTISLEGECPGPIVLHFEGATPDYWAMLAYSPTEGEMVLPMGPCGGTVLGLSAQGLRGLRTFRTGAEGRGDLRGRTSEAGCGGFLQMIVYYGHPCQTSNVVQIPQ